MRCKIIFKLAVGLLLIMQSSFAADITIRVTFESDSDQDLLLVYQFLAPEIPGSDVTLYTGRGRNIKLKSADSTNAVFLILSNRQRYRPIYVYDGDTINVSSIQNSFTFSGSNAVENNFMESLYLKGYHLMSRDQWNFGDNTVEELEIKSKSHYNVALSNFETFKKFHNVDAKFERYLKRDLHSTYLMNLINQLNRYASINALTPAFTRLTTELDKSISFFLGEINRMSFPFQNAQATFHTYKCWRERLGISTFDTSRTFDASTTYDENTDFDVRFTHLSTMPEPLRTEVMFKRLYTIFVQDSWGLRDQNKYLQSFLQLSNRPDLSEILSRKAGIYQNKAEVEEFAKLIKGTDQKTPTMLFNFDNKSIPLSSLVSESSPTLLYVYFWASWCQPCIAEIKKNQQMYSTGSVNANIKIALISIDEDEESWKKSISQYGLSTNTLNYRVDQLSEFFKIISPDRMVPKKLLMNPTRTKFYLSFPSVNTLTDQEIGSYR